MEDSWFCETTSAKLLALLNPEVELSTPVARGGNPLAAALAPKLKSGYALPWRADCEFFFCRGDLSSNAVCLVSMNLLPTTRGKTRTR